MTNYLRISDIFRSELTWKQKLQNLTRRVPHREKYATIYFYADEETAMTFETYGKVTRLTPYQNQKYHLQVSEQNLGNVDFILREMKRKEHPAYV